MPESAGAAPRPYDDVSDDLIDIRELINVFRRRFWVLVSVAAIIVVAAVLVTFQMTPLYTATSQVALEIRQSQVVDFEAVLSGLPPDSAMVDTEVEVIRSRELAGGVVDRMGLMDVPEFNAELRDPSWISTVKSAIGNFLTALMPAQARDAQAFDDHEAQVRDRVISKLLSNITVRRQGLTYIIEISATSENPRLARDIANAYADQYLVAQLDAKYEATQRANEWLNERVETLREEVRAAEDAVAQYREQEGLLDARGSTLTEQQISDVNAQLALQRAELAEAQARLESVRSQIDRGVGTDTIAEVLQSDVIRDLRSQQAAVNQRHAELSSRYGPRHPQILTVERERADIEQQIEREIARIVSNLSNEVTVARERVRSLEGSLAQLRNELADNNRSLVRLRELERGAEASRTLYESILNRFRQTSEQESLTSADARIVSEAAIPLEPSAPNVTLNLALAIVLGGVCGVGVVMLLEMLDNGLYRDTDIETKLGLSHIASVPRLGSNLLKRLSGRSQLPADYILEKPFSGFSESFRTIRSAIRLSGIDSEAKLVAITSAVPGEGKTSVSMCLSHISALSNARTLVIDCDLRRRMLSKSTTDDVSAGLLEVLNGETDLDSAIVRDDRSGLNVLGLSRAEFTPRDVFGTNSFKALLERVRAEYDLVVLDTAPVLAVADTLSIASQVDLVVFTTLWKRTPASVARAAVEALQSANATVLGGVLNGVDLDAQARYGYGNAGYYYKSYAKYYTD